MSTHAGAQIDPLRPIRAVGAYLGYGSKRLKIYAGVVAPIVVFGLLFAGLVFIFWMQVRADRKSQTNDKIHLSDCGSQVTSSPALSDEVIPEKKFWRVRGLLDTLLLLLMIFIVISLAIGYSG